jgi:hypothetical protein
MKEVLEEELVVASCEEGPEAEVAQRLLRLGERLRDRGYEVKYVSRQLKDVIQLFALVRPKGAKGSFAPYPMGEEDL